MTSMITPHYPTAEYRSDPAALNPARSNEALSREGSQGAQERSSALLPLTSTTTLSCSADRPISALESLPSDLHSLTMSFLSLKDQCALISTAHAFEKLPPIVRSLKMGYRDVLKVKRKKIFFKTSRLSIDKAEVNNPALWRRLNESFPRANTICLNSPCLQPAQRVKELVASESTHPAVGSPQPRKLHLVDCSGLDGKGMQTLLACNPAVTAIELSRYRLLTEEAAVGLAQAPGLTDIKLTSCALSDLGLLTIGSSRLTRIELSLCKKVTDAGLAAFAQRSPSLVQVGLIWSDVTNVGLKALAYHCPNLTRLELAIPSDKEGVDFGQIAAQFFRLTHLYLHSRVTDATLALIAASCTQLKEFGFSAGSITDEGLESLARGCRELTSIAFGGFGSGLTRKGLQALGESCPKLIDVTLGNYSSLGLDPALQVLSERCPQLSSVKWGDLSSGEYYRVTNQGLKGLAACPNLTQIDFSANSAADVTHESLELLGKQCTQLRSIKLGWSRALKSIGLQALVKSCGRLSEIKLDLCDLSDADLMEVARRCPELTYLDLGSRYKNAQVTDQGFTALAAHCSSLTYLRLGCLEVSEEGLNALVEQCRSLRQLHLATVRPVNYHALKALVQGLELTHLTLEGSVSLTQEQLVEIAISSEQLTFIDIPKMRSLSSENRQRLFASKPRGMTLLTEEEHLDRIRDREGVFG